MALTQDERHKLYFAYVEIVKDCREAIGFSQARLADEAGLSNKYITLVEGGKRTPTLESLLALMAAAEVKRETAEDLVQEVLGSFEWKA